MDFWVVAAATGAGYVAKNWQSLSSEKDSLSKLPSMASSRAQTDACQVFDKMPSSVFPLPKLARICWLDGDVSSPDKEQDKVGTNLQDHEDLPVCALPPIFTDQEVFQENLDEIDRKHELRATNMNGKSFSSVPPLVVTSNGNDDHKNIIFFEESKAFYEPIGSAKLPRRPKQMHSQVSNDILPLSIGITIGILSTTVTNKREIENLNELLEQAENMVRDLQNELEMKDRITVNDHGVEPVEHETDGPESEKPELTSDIEAELEAELEILEENMKGYSYTLRIDSDHEADMAQGDLNLDALTWQLNSRSDSDHADKSEPAYEPRFTPNYAVSSLDLRLRLHEVIESELRARVEELEAVLENRNSNRSKSRSPEPQEPNSFWDFDHTRIESSSSTP